MQKRLIVDISGAWRASYALRLREVPCAGGHTVHLVMSARGEKIQRQVLDQFGLAPEETPRWGER